MVDPVLWQQFMALVEEPNGKNYLAARTTLRTSTSYRPYSNHLEKTHELLETDLLTEAVDLLMAALPNLLLSPRVHRLLAIIAIKLEDREQAEMEVWMSHACCQGILGTGDGTPAEPYLVLRIEDEYDVLEYLEKQMTMQRLMENDGRHFDIITCDDESEIWFDVTDLRSQGMSQEDLDDFEREMLS